MTDVIVSVVAEQIIVLIAKQVQYQINLVIGVEEEVLQLSDELSIIRNVLDDAENQRFKDSLVDRWLSRLEETSREMEDVLDEWSYTILKHEIEQHRSDGAVVAPKKNLVSSFILSSSSSCVCFKKLVVRHDIAKKILNVKAKLDRVLKEKIRYKFARSRPTAETSSLKSWRNTTSFKDLEQIQGRDDDRDVLVTKLVGRQEELYSIQVVSIVGVGGLGKTTLAQLVYGDSRVENFFDLKTWVCVSDTFDLAAIARGIIRSVDNGDFQSTSDLETLLHSVKNTVTGRRFLLVLDDVWTKDSTQWDPLKTALKSGAVGSKILITTRDAMVAEIAMVEIVGTINNDIHRLGELSHDDCWLLMRRRIALFGKNTLKFEDIGKEIAKKCSGLPLAAKTLGSLLRSKNTLNEWKNVLESEIWQLEEAKIDIFPHLLLSYNELSPRLKRCFSYCAVFPKDYRINVERLIEDWMALGYLGFDIDNMKLKGQECFDILAACSLFQELEKSHSDDEIKISCKMHDIVHDFAQFLRKSGKVEATGKNKKTTCQTCDPQLVSNINEFCSLVWENDYSPRNLCACLKRVRVLRAPHWVSIPRGMENMIHLTLLNLKNFEQLSPVDLKIIFQLYNLQNLNLSHCNLEEIPKEIGNLIRLIQLDLSENRSLSELPTEIGKLVELRHLLLKNNRALEKLPESICSLDKLQTLDISANVQIIPQGVGELSNLQILPVFWGGSGWNNLGILKQLNHLGGRLLLLISLGADDIEQVVEGAREAELRNKMELEHLEIYFEKDELDECEESSLVRRDVVDALEPPPNLTSLLLRYYNGPRLPLWMLGWVVSPLNQLAELNLRDIRYVSSLPVLANMPCLETLRFISMEGVRFVGREFLGITTTATDIVVFPKLKYLVFNHLYNWTEWEDITIEEEGFTIMPCLTRLDVNSCCLTELPHRLLHKLSALNMLSITDSRELTQRYKYKNGSYWKSISQYNPTLELYHC